jgi:hypothetical protein
MNSLQLLPTVNWFSFWYVICFRLHLESFPHLAFSNICIHISLFSLAILHTLFPDLPSILESILFLFQRLPTKVILVSTVIRNQDQFCNCLELDCDCRLVLLDIKYSSHRISVEILTIINSYYGTCSNFCSIFYVWQCL